MSIRSWVLGLLVCAVSSFLFAQREPVLKQIDLPHAYYFREMYLPQLTTGPSSVAWAPDSRALVYSMAGSLWRQEVGSSVAEQLTAGPGYDYQPDWSTDGRSIVYTTYNNDAMELQVLDVASGQSHPLTHGGAVNLEPRFSPDGKRIVFVSTSFHGRFHIFVGKFENGELKDVQRLTGENRSSLPRYYYSQFDHEISPVWSPDGSEIVFVSNRGHIYGTGGFWRMKAEPGAEAREIHYEETTWKARPDFSPDGKRLVYASYLGQAVAPALGNAFAGWRRVPALVWRLRQHQPALVTRWQTDRIHLQPRRQHFPVATNRAGRRADAGRREGAKVFEADGAPSCVCARPCGQPDTGPDLYHRRRWPRLCSRSPPG